MGNRTENGARVNAALGALVVDGCFSLAFIVHLLAEPSLTLTSVDYLCMAFIFCVLLTACGLIHYEYWSVNASLQAKVKTLRIRELNEGAAIEFDGKSYRVDNIDRSRGEIVIERVGQPGSIIVQIEGEG